MMQPACRGPLSAMEPIPKGCVEEMRVWDQDSWFVRHFPASLEETGRILALFPDIFDGGLKAERGWRRTRKLDPFLWSMMNGQTARKGKRPAEIQVPLGIEALRRDRCGFLDWMLPGIERLDVCRRIRFSKFRSSF